MATEAKKVKTALGNNLKAANDPFTYSEEIVRNFEFSNYVHVSTAPRGVLLSFGKNHPSGEKPIVYREIFLPVDVAYVLSQIIASGVDKLKERGVVDIIEEVIVKKKKKKKK